MALKIVLELYHLLCIHLECCTSVLLPSNLIMLFCLRHFESLNLLSVDKFLGTIIEVILVYGQRPSWLSYLFIHACFKPLKKNLFPAWYAVELYAVPIKVQGDHQEVMLHWFEIVYYRNSDCMCFCFCFSSSVVGARHPFAKDPDLDYEIDSDGEWEEVCLLCYKCHLIVWDIGD